MTDLLIKLSDVRKFGTQLYINKEYIIKDLEKKLIVKNNKGSALIMVLMATIGLSVLGIVIMNAKKQVSNTARRYSADRDIDRIMSRIASLVVSPADCNANFKGKSFTTPSTLTALYRCSAGTCNGSGTPVVALNFNNWVVFPNELVSSTQQTGRVKITSVTYSLTSVQSTATGTRSRAGFSSGQPAVITLVVSFERDAGFAPGGGGAQVTTKISRTQPFTVQAFVVTSTSTHNPGGVPADVITDNPTGLILGCPSSPTTTYPYM